MAVTDAYCDPSTYRAIVAKSDVGDDADVARDLVAVSRFLDRKLGRFFTRDAAPVARVFRTSAARGGALPLGWAESENPWRFGQWTRMLPTDDIATTSGLVIKIDEDQDGSFADETALASTDYELWPENAALGAEPQPYTGIYIPEYSTKVGFPPNTRIQVTAAWGWPSVPAAVERATAHLCGILRLESPRATSRVSELGESIGTSREAQRILDDLTRQYRRTLGTVI